MLFDASNRIPFFLNYGEFSHLFHKQFLVVLNIKCHSQCLFATAPEENVPGAVSPGTRRKDTTIGKKPHVIIMQKEHNLEFLPTF